MKSFSFSGSENPIKILFRFLRKSQLSISDDLRAQIKAIKSNPDLPLSPHIFDPMQHHVEVTIRDNIYPTFLCSEMYILYIQQMSALQERCHSSGATGSGSAGSSGSGGSCGGSLAGAGACAIPAATTVKQQQLVPPGAFINLPVSSVSGPPAGTCSASGSVRSLDFGQLKRVHQRHRHTAPQLHAAHAARGLGAVALRRLREGASAGRRWRICRRCSCARLSDATNEGPTNSNSEKKTGNSTSRVCLSLNSLSSNRY